MPRSSENSLRTLIREIHRRSLWQVLGIYLVSGWIVYQVVQALTEGLGLPEWFPAFALVLLIIGLPVVLATAFVQEGGPGADHDDLTPVSAPDEVETPEVGLFTWRNAVVGGMGAFVLMVGLAAGWLLLGRGVAPSTEEAGSSGAAADVPADRPAIAVLPFENMSGSQEDRYFTDGMHEELLTRLSKIGGLRVISRTSVLEYENAPANLREIAERLRVGFIGEGSVRRAQDQVRISVQLIDAATDEHLWAETYDRELSPDAIFDIQSDVAQRIADALKAELTPEERARVAERPTESGEAYDYYLLYRRDAEAGNWSEAGAMLRRATQIDPAYSEAWARLAGVHVTTWWTRADYSDQRLEMARMALERARTLDPDRPSTLRAEGQYAYYVEEDWARADRFLERAIEADPNDASAWGTLGALRRRTGDFDGAIEAYTRSESLDPAIKGYRENLADTYAFLRRWEDAHRVEARARLWNPTFVGRWIQLGTSWYRQGEVERAREQLRSGLDAGLSTPSYMPPLARNMLARTYIAERQYDEALSLAEGFEYDFAGGGVWEPRALLIAQIHDFAGRYGEARRWYDSARVALEPRVEDDPALALPSYGLVLAGLGRDDEAVDAGRRGIDQVPLDHDAFLGTMPLEYLARIYARVGQIDAAVEIVEDLMARPSFLTVARLSMEPYWDPLREHPRFRELVEGG